ncbi:MAG: hypothetical protein HC793_04395 [Aquincola sp.]|nr:hypothetical protein [Aquincola sp.]
MGRVDVVIIVGKEPVAAGDHRRQGAEVADFGYRRRTAGLVFFPGGFGTLDEMFEVLTLTQTGKVRKRPIVLVGREFWTKLVNFDWLVETGMIAAADLQLFHLVETADEAWAVLESELGLGAPDTLTGEFADDV